MATSASSAVLTAIARRIRAQHCRSVVILLDRWRCGTSRGEPVSRPRATGSGRENDNGARGSG